MLVVAPWENLGRAVRAGRSRTAVLLPLGPLGRPNVLRAGGRLRPQGRFVREGLTRADGRRNGSTAEASLAGKERAGSEDEDDQCTPQGGQANDMGYIVIQAAA